MGDRWRPHHCVRVMLLVAAGVLPGGALTAGGEPPIRIGGESSAGGAPETREEQLRRLARSGLNAVCYAGRLTNPAITEMGRDASGEVALRFRRAAPSRKIPLCSRQDYLAFARAARRHGLDVYFTEYLYSGEWQQLAGLGPYTGVFVGGPCRHGAPGESRVPAPLEKQYWLGMLLCAARFYAGLSRECPNVKGFLVDFETYGPEHLWRSNASFDDVTFAAVTTEMRRRELLSGSTDARAIPREERYAWLDRQERLQAYLDVQGELVREQVARPFRQAIDRVNPGFRVGFYPYAPNWFCQAWARGLATQRAPVLVLSENEYHGVQAPQTLCLRDSLKALGANHRYLPGFMIHAGSHMPGGLERDVRRARRFAPDGYWVYSTTSFAESQPERLAAPAPGQRKPGWWITAAPGQFWQALSRANAGSGSLPDREAYPREMLPPAGARLLTGNRHYPGPRLALPVTVRCTPEPALPLYEDTDGRKLFDGGEYHHPWTAAWRTEKGKRIAVVVDLTRPCRLERLYLRAGTHLEEYAPAGGKLYLATSQDGSIYYDVAEVAVDAGGKLRTPFLYEDAGIEAQWIRVEFEPDEVRPSSCFSISELALWGRPAAQPAGR